MLISGASPESTCGTTPPNLPPGIEICILMLVSCRSDHQDPRSGGCHRVVTELSQVVTPVDPDVYRRTVPPTFHSDGRPTHSDLGEPSRVCASPHLTQLRPVMTAARVPPADRVFAAPDLPPCSADSDANLPSPELADAQTSLMHPLMNTTLRLRSVRTAHLPQMGPCVPRHLDISRQRPF